MPEVRVGAAVEPQSVSLAEATVRPIDLDLVLRWLLAGAALAFMAGFLVASYFRLTFPFPLAPMEAPIVQAVRRIVHDQALYGPPGLEYVPTVYAPLYFYISALPALVLGPSLLTLRLVSLAASLGSAALVARLVWRETGDRLAALAGAGLFICATGLSETSLDVARVDALALFFTLAALDAARGRRSRTASGVLIGLAILTKQTTLAVGVVLALEALLSGRPRRCVEFVLGAFVVVGAAALVLGTFYGSWPLLYLVELPRQHALQLDRLEGFWSRQLLPAFTLPLVALPVFLLGSLLRGRRDTVRFWGLAALGMLGMAWGASLNRWSGDNVVLPAYAVLAVGFGLGLAEALRALDGPARVFRRYALVLALLELVFVHYNPRATSPLRSDVEAGQRLVAAIAAQPGRVYGPEFPELLYQAGKGEQAFGLSVGELQGIFGGRPRPEAGIWTAAYTQALREREFDALVLEADGVLPFLTETARDQGYVDMGPLMPAGDEFYRLQSPYMPNLHVWRHP